MVIVDRTFKYYLYILCVRGVCVCFFLCMSLAIAVLLCDVSNKKGTISGENEFLALQDMSMKLELSRNF